MDTLSSSASTLKVSSALHSSHREFQHFKPPYTSYQFPWNTTTGPKSPLSNRTTSQPLHPKGALSSARCFSTTNTKTLSTKSSPITHESPTSGYAAALVEIAQNNGSLQTVRKDAEKLLKLLLLLDDAEKGEAVKEVVKRGELNRFLVVLLKLLVKRKKIDMVREVLMEFERICDELSGTNVVWVSSARKMKEDQLFGIARRVQKINGAINVKIKNFVGERPLSSFSFAF
uniref:Uncharacterized protein MANES_05G019500 n=1 Tax=Rhizophora mucronata TaxID=61149 RepID=A0A2P2Q3B9_RHIMU